MSNKERALLENFVVDNEGLDKLESKLAQFNIFEAIGVVRQEIRHSNFLAFILNPSQNHRLDDIFLKRLLKRVLLEVDALIDLNYLKISPIDIDIADLKDAEVRREWKNIDILIHSPSNRLVCAIENKIDSKEHSDQLHRYREIVLRQYKNCRAILIYLSPDGEPPKEPEDKYWIAYSYSRIAELIDNICENYKSTLCSDVQTLMTHYSNLIRRYIVSDSDIAELCRKIYSRHKQALDLIFEHRPDVQSEIAKFVEELVNKEAELVLDHSSKRFIVFAVEEWDKFPFQMTAYEGTKSKRILLFAFDNLPDNLFLSLVICPGNPSIQQDIYQIAKDNPANFLNMDRKLKNKWTAIDRRQILKPTDYDNADIEDLTKKVQDKWQQFFDHDLPTIQKIIRNSLLILESFAWRFDDFDSDRSY
jgi:hypothetical protein